MDNKTISELARILDTSTDTIRRTIKRHNISTEKANGITVLSKAAQEIIAEKLQRTCNAPATQNNKSATQLQRTCNAGTENSQETGIKCNAPATQDNAAAAQEIELLKAEIEQLKAQAAKDEQYINDLKADKDKLNEHIDSLLEQLSTETKERQAILTKYMLLEQKQPETESAADTSGADQSEAEPSDTEQKQPAEKKGAF